MAKSPARGADFVGKIVKDPKNPPSTVMLTGYLGASSEEDHTRLYFDPHLSAYVEIPDDAILHTQEVSAEGGLGATHVWIRRDAQLTYGPAGAERPKGTFLEGPIMQQHMAAAAAGAARAVPAAARAAGAPQAAGLTLAAHCTQVCAPSFLGMGCGGGGEMLAGGVTLAAHCTQVCAPSFLGMGCPGGGGVLAGGVTLWAHCTQVCGPSFLGMACDGSGLPRAV
jgi:hypothetical protein